VQPLELAAVLVADLLDGSPQTSYLTLCRYVSRPKIILHIVKCLLRSSSEIFCYLKNNFTI
jgi:hypothetical protein